METKPTIDELVEKVLSELERVGYSYSYLCGFKAFCKRIISFALSKNEEYFSITFGADFLREKCDCPTNVLAENMSQKQRNLIRKIRILEDYQLNRAIARRATGPGYI